MVRTAVSSWASRVAVGGVAADVELLAIGPADARVDDERSVLAALRTVVVHDDGDGRADALLAAEIARAAAGRRELGARRRIMRRADQPQPAARRIGPPRRAAIWSASTPAAARNRA